MADFWNDLGENIVLGVNVLTDKTGEIVDKIADKTGEFTDKGRAKWELYKLQKDRKDMASELGELFYLMMQQDNLNTDQLKGKCREIAELDEKIASYDVQEGKPQGRSQGRPLK